MLGPNLIYLLHGAESLRS